MSSITDMNMERSWNVAGRTRRANRCRTEAPKSSLIGLLAGMLASGYVTKDAAGCYRLGPACFR
jgi:hypothetical protein